MKVVKFFSKSCTPCKIADLVLAEKGIEFDSVDVEENEALAGKYNVMKVPTLIYTDDEGHEIKRAIGLEDIKEL